MRVGREADKLLIGGDGWEQTSGADGSVRRAAGEAGVNVGRRYR